MKQSLKRAVILAASVGASLAGLAALPASASAQSYYQDRSYYDCRSQQSGNTVAGAIIGGLAGGVIGNSVAGRGDRGVGTAVGAGVGAAVGAGVGSSSAHCYDRPSYDYDRRDYDSNGGYYDSYGNYHVRSYYGSPQTTPDYYRNSSPGNYYDPDAY